MGLPLLPMRDAGLKRAGILHVEFQVQDREAAEKFLGELFGWEFTHHSAQNYSTFDPGNGVTGGINVLEDALGDPGTVLIYVESEDVSADLRKAESLGAEVLVPRTLVPGMGWLGMFVDPAGNRVALLNLDGAMSKEQ
jgi:uncharacterized protein